MKQLKMHLSVDDQVNLMISRGMIVTDFDAARAFLSANNYYRFSGYFGNFKEPCSEMYKPGTNFENIQVIYEFDKKLTRILMYILEDIEETLKTRLSYNITAAHPDDPLIYLKASIYRDRDAYTQFVEIVNKFVRLNNGLPFIKHHIAHYDGQIPFWVIVELLTMGNIHALYHNLMTSYQKAIARNYGTSVEILTNWIQNLTFTRNHLAHYMRIYNFNFGRTPMHCKNHHTYKVTTNKVFDQLYVMFHMYSNKEEWNSYVLVELQRLMDAYKTKIDLSCLGFPENWTEVLTQDIFHDIAGAK